MDLTNLSREDLIIITTKIIGGKSLEEIEKEFISQEMRISVDSFHTLMCREDHLEKGSGCSFYFETAYEEPCRARWVEYAKQIMIDCKASLSEFKTGIGKMFMIQGFIEKTIDRESLAVARVIYSTLLSLSTDSLKVAEQIEESQSQLQSQNPQT